MIGEVDFIRSIEDFPWESEVQRKSYLSYVQYLRKIGRRIPDLVDPAVAFLVQKSHESHEWNINLLANQVESLQKQIQELRKGSI